MNITICTIAGGNSTLIYRNLPSQELVARSKSALQVVEQVGCITGNTSGNKPIFRMMGDELSINGTLAAGKVMSERKKFSVFGLDRDVAYFEKGNRSFITLNLRFQILDTIVLFESIGYILKDSSFCASKEYMKLLCRKYSLPAFGVIKIKNEILYPSLFVKKTDSLVQETACGSGSIAVSLLTGKSEIPQTTGEYISVRRNNSTFTIGASVETVTYNFPLNKKEMADTIRKEKIYE